MKTLVLLLLGIEMLVIMKVNAGLAEASKRGPVFEWSNKLSISREQQDLINLYEKLEGVAPDEAKRREVEGQLAEARAKLGTNAVRPSHNDELIISKTGQTNVFRIYNPTQQNLSFTVSIKGEEERMGTRMASVGRTTYLPPHGSLLVKNIYWTTPRMAEDKAK